MAKVSSLLTGDPRRLGPYQLDGRIGQGGQGTVYLARTAAGEPVAIKLLHAEWTRDASARSRFAREVAAASRVAPFCTARILQTQLDGDLPYVVSEYIDGPSLYEVVSQHGPLAGSALDRLAVHTATALSAIHQAGVIHRDFKPGNVLMGQDGPRVIDFGVARWDDMSATISSQVLGTPGYMAPEIVRGETAGPPADVFAWGATITFAATGRSPFDAPNMAAIVHQITSGQANLGHLGGYLRNVVAGCLAKDPGARPSAFELLMSLLQHSASDEPTPQVPVKWAGRTVPVAGEQAMVLGAAGVAGVAGAAGEAAWRGPAANGATAGGGSDGGTAVLPPGQQPWPQQQPFPWPQQAGAAYPGQGAAYPGRAGRPPYAGGPAPARRPGRGAGRGILVAGLVIAGLLAFLLVPALIRSAVQNGSPGASGSNPAAHHPSGAPAQPHKKAPTTAAIAVPGNFAGTWSGRVTQLSGTVKQYSMTVMLPSGAASGKMSIPTIGCAATVTVTAADQNHVVLNETLVSDPRHKCAASATITLRHFGDQRVFMFWQQTDDPLNTASGLLDRGGSNGNDLGNGNGNDDG